MNQLVLQAVEAWQTNHRINLLILEQLDATALASSVSGKGRTVGGQFAHLHAVRLQWLQAGDTGLFSIQQKITRDEEQLKEILVSRMNESAGGITAWMQTADESGKIKGYRKGLIQLLAYLISHEAHHRGNILLTLKQNKIVLPDHVKWAIWDWQKI